MSGRFFLFLLPRNIKKPEYNDLELLLALIGSTFIRNYKWTYLSKKNQNIYCAFILKYFPLRYHLITLMVLNAVIAQSVFSAWLLYLGFLSFSRLLTFDSHFIAVQLCLNLEYFYKFYMSSSYQKDFVKRLINNWCCQSET